MHAAKGRDAPTKLKSLLGACGTLLPTLHQRRRWSPRLTPMMLSIDQLLGRAWRTQQAVATDKVVKLVHGHCFQLDTKHLVYGRSGQIGLRLMKLGKRLTKISAWSQQDVLQHHT
jgi:hypothetical protein